jgi:TolB-like protein/class 3 adenylate cyclase
MRETSKLAVILHADVVGSTSLVHADERIAHQRMQDAFRRFSDVICAYGGTAHEIRGDALVAEFARASDALCAALAFQMSNADANAAIFDHIRPLLRIGIAMGEVVIADSTVTGTGVVLAQRIEQVAEDGGVCIQGAVYETVPRRLPFEYCNLGEMNFKGFDEPARVHSVTLSGGAKVPEPEVPRGLAVSAKDNAGVVRPSIVVMPFTTASADREQEAFANGMTDDLTTDLSKVHGIVVLSRTSAVTLKSRDVDLGTVAEELDVRYAIEGRIRAAGGRIRINVELIDAISGQHVWADRFDGDLADVFELQDQVCAKIVDALSVKLTDEESMRLNQVHTSSLEAYELFVRARATPYPPLPSRIQSAMQMLEQVIEIDPEFAGGYAGLAELLAFFPVFGHEDPTEQVNRGFELAKKAISLDESFALSYSALGSAHVMRRQYDEAIAAGRQAITRQPSDADAHSRLAWILGFAGDLEACIDEIEIARRLNPLFVNGPYLNIKHMSLSVNGRYQESIDTFEENVRVQGPVGPPALAFAIASYFALERYGDAERYLARLQSDFPAFRLRGWNYLAVIRDPAVCDRITELMLHAGITD